VGEVRTFLEIPSAAVKEFHSQHRHRRSERGNHAMAQDKIRSVAAAARLKGDYTPGMLREQAVATEGLWAGLVRTDAGMTSGWHHHGDYETAIYVLSGRLRMESGAGGSEVVEAGPGDFVHVPRETIHRESNPSSEESQLIVVRAGTGEPVFNVEEPES
jgi:uncharacterized RmlC-like cupin family protein